MAAAEDSSPGSGNGGEQSATGVCKTKSMVLGGSKESGLPREMESSWRDLCRGEVGSEGSCPQCTRGRHGLCFPYRVKWTEVHQN